MACGGRLGGLRMMEVKAGDAAIWETVIGTNRETVTLFTAAAAGAHTIQHLPWHGL